MNNDDVITNGDDGIPAESVAVSEHAPSAQRSDRCPECGEPTSGDGRLAPLCPQCLVWIALDGEAAEETGNDADGPSEETYPYRIVRVLGEGGMGIVYLAEQQEPVHRQVAVKVLRPGLDSKTVLARFEAERQALAMMDHPNIAKVLDAGQTRTGRPYFVMELVEGEPITQYCDRHRLPLRERLELFSVVCRAVQHAHHKGVIHRDLKPSNILVSTIDEQPVPKVIDFGLAKATGAPLTDKTLMTRQGELMGTPEYMSPEQAGMDGTHLDTRTDVYSLGVVLHELLVGAPPFEPDTLRRAGYEELIRILREEEPRRPSMRVSGPGVDAAVAVARHEEDADSLARRLRGDLDWIVVKALAKDPDRRYPTPNALAVDVGRYLNHEPVEAGPPSARYRFKKFARRNRVALAVSAAVAFGLLSAAAGLSVALVESNRQRARVEAALGEAEGARTETEAVVGFLEGMLAAVDPAEQGRDVTVREVLDEAAGAVGDHMEGRPLVEARLRGTIGRTYLALGDPRKAGPLLEEALRARETISGPEARETLEAASDLAESRLRTGRHDEAGVILASGLETSRRVLGKEDDQTLILMNNLANVRFGQGKYEEAAELFRESIEIRRRAGSGDDPEVITLLNNLAVVQTNMGRYAAAERTYLETLDTGRRVLGEEHPDVLGLTNNLASLHTARGNYDDAARLLEPTVEIARRVLGEEHQHTLAFVGELASAYFAQGRYQDAERLHVEALEARRRMLGHEHPDTLNSANNLGRTLFEQGRLPEAERTLAETWDVRTRILGVEHRHTLNTLCNLARVFEAQGRHDEAERSFRQVMETRARVLGEEHPATLAVTGDLGHLYSRRGRQEDAERMQGKALEAATRTLDPGHPVRIKLQRSHALALSRRERYAEAEAILLGLYEALPDESLARRGKTAQAIVDLYAAWGRAEQAAVWRDRAMARAR